MAGSVIGSVASGIIGGIGNKKAGKQARAGAAAAAPQIVQASPFDINTIFGNSSGGEFGISKFGQFAQDELQKLMSSSGKDNRDTFSKRFFNAVDGLESQRESRAFQSLESKLFNKGGVSTGTADQISRFRSDIDAARQGRAINALMAGEQVFSNRANDFLSALRGAQGLQGSQLSQIGTGIQGSNVFTPRAIGGNPAAANAGLFEAGNTQGFFNGLGGTVGGALDAGISSFGNPFASQQSFGSPGGGFFNPGAVNFGSNPFTSLGFG